MRRNLCKICGEYAGKSDTCAICKSNFPFKPSGKGDYPFERIKVAQKKRR
jgi:hypothetical protein